ncbi:hypothetical protein DFH94DRAFT_301394 [Russula ochroleuca]|uniref:Uncharacterized protein n=1 Tax=Russula ochroleuca TaxID=152965 RepID=A0A9P5JX04_9AGAM|nr:hypothetical protein DFH94DRAFT_301394 [Russula ochroleuca]
MPEYVSELKSQQAAVARIVYCTRRGLLTTTGYPTYCDKVLPIQCLYLPAISQAHELSCFRELLNLDRESDVQTAERVHAAGQLRESLSEWMSLHKDRYTCLFPFRFDGFRGQSMEVKLLTDSSLRFGVMLECMISRESNDRRVGVFGTRHGCDPRPSPGTAT